MSVPMEGKGEKSKGKRSTKNSKELRVEESDMEKALRKSQKEEQLKERLKRRKSLKMRWNSLELKLRRTERNVRA